jgi:hypothetical protein
MQVLRIRNQGILDLNSLLLMGASTKQDQPDAIGKYGTGWKYALATLLRNGIDIEIYSGGDRIAIDTRPVTMRDNHFDMVTINGKDSHFTTNMGPDWKVWMAIREIFCNAIDEGGYTVDELDYEPGDAIHCEQHTVVLINITIEIEEIIANWMSYFAFDRTDDVLKLPGVTVYKRTKSICSIIYRKGIMVGMSPLPGCYDYDFHDIDINEIREMKDFGDAKSKMKQLLTNNSKLSTEVLKTIVESEGTWEKTLDIAFWDGMYYKENKNVWVETIGNRTIMPLEFKGQLETEKMQEEGGVVYLPASMAELISKNIPEIKVAGYATGGDQMHIEQEPTDDEFMKMADKLEDVRDMWPGDWPGVNLKLVTFPKKPNMLIHHDQENIYVTPALIKEADEDIIYYLFKHILLQKLDMHEGSASFEEYLLRQLIKQRVMATP